MAASTERWLDHFIDYEDALGSFYALQDATQDVLAQSAEAMGGAERIAGLRKSVLEAHRELRWSAATGRVLDIERASGSVDVDGTALRVTNVVAYLAHPGAVLHLGFRADSRSLRRLPKVAGLVRIKFPFAEWAYVADFRLVGFKIQRDYFAFQFATVDPS
jgi:hypothetical protein